MLIPQEPLRRIQRFELRHTRHAFVFERRPTHLTAALAFTGDPDRIRVGLAGPCDRGTTPATLVPLLRLLMVDPFAHLLVLPPDPSDDPCVYVGPAAALARRIQRRAPACWGALAPVCLDEAAMGAIYPRLEASDLVTDVLVGEGEAY